MIVAENPSAKPISNCHEKFMEIIGTPVDKMYVVNGMKSFPWIQNKHSFVVGMFKYENSWQPWAWQSEATIFHRTDNSRRHLKCLYNSWTLPKKITLILGLIDSTNRYFRFVRDTLEIICNEFFFGESRDGCFFFRCFLLKLKRHLRKFALNFTRQAVSHFGLFFACSNS